jgi:hypothetical protein
VLIHPRSTYQISTYYVTKGTLPFRLKLQASKPQSRLTPAPQRFVAFNASYIIHHTFSLAPCRPVYVQAILNEPFV